MNVDRLRHESSLLSPNDVCAEILALSIVEYTYTPSLSITIDLDRSGGKLYDSGRGIALVPDRGDTISHAERAHTCIYPCVSASPEVDSILRELIWGARGALGPALPTAACPVYAFVSERGGEVWSQSYRYGTPVGPPRMLGSTSTTGTTITFETAAPIDHAAFATLVNTLSSRIPGLLVTLRT
jgi:DNA gyrase/topoisomerase IV subunit B